MKTKQIRIGVYTPPTEQASVIPISNLIEILKPLSKSIVIITGNAAYNFFKNYPGVSCYDNSHPIEKTRIKKIFNYIRAQFSGSYFLLKNRNNVEVWILFMGGEREILPILTAKLLKKPTLLILTGSIVKTANYSRDPFLIPIKILNWITCNLVSGIILYSSQLIPETGLNQHKKKISIAQRHFINLDLFKCDVNFDDRPDTIGYIGRLSEEKGVINFVSSFTQIHSQNPDIHFFIGGDGVLRDQIMNNISLSGLKENVISAGWIPHKELPQYLNRLKLLVLPSYTEGLPNIMLEAMACGTPVLVTQVGAISDVITDEITGFILPDNSPLTIAESVIRALNHPDIRKISDEGRILITTKFSFENAVESYATILSNFSHCDEKP